MPAAVQRSAIAALRQRFTLQQTRRTVPIMFSIKLVHARGRPRRVVVRRRCPTTVCHNWLTTAVGLANRSGALMTMKAG
jgi:hypothetical protein